MNHRLGQFFVLPLLMGAVLLASCTNTSPEAPAQSGAISPTSSNVAGSGVRSLPPNGVPDGFPEASSTGVRDGVVLQDSDSISVDQEGAVIAGLRVNGRITVNASNVTIRDVLIEGGGNGYPIRVSKGVQNVVIEYVEVDNQDATGIGIFFNGGSGTVRYADIHSAEDGIRIQADDVVIENSYIHDLQRAAGGHHDSIQIREGNNVTIRGNSLLPYVASTGDPMNAAIQVGSLSGSPIENLRVENNFLDGGNYTVNGGRAGDIASGQFVNNVFGPNARYGPHSRLDNAVWEGNTWFETGSPVPS